MDRKLLNLPLSVRDIYGDLVIYEESQHIFIGNKGHIAVSEVNDAKRYMIIQVLTE